MDLQDLGAGRRGLGALLLPFIVSGLGARTRERELIRQREQRKYEQETAYEPLKTSHVTPEEHLIRADSQIAFGDQRSPGIQWEQGIGNGGFLPPRTGSAPP